MSAASNSASKPRCLTPDCEEIRKFAASDKRKRSLDRIFKDAGLCGSRLLHDWETGKSQPLRATLVALMKELEGCNDIKQITFNDVPTPDTAKPTCASNHFRLLVLLAVSSCEFRDAMFVAGGCETIEVGEFTRTHFRREVTHLSLTMAEMDEVLTELCRMGWLCPSQASTGTGFFYRQPNPRQCREAFYNRVFSEQRGIRHAYFAGRNPADDVAISEYKQIVEQQQITLDDLREATRTVRKERTNKRAIRVVNLDFKFHHVWGGYDPSTAALLTVCLGAHYLQISRLIAVHELFESKGIHLPQGYPTLPDIVDNFYEETSKIFQAFVVALSKGDDEMHGLMSLVESHAKSGYPYVEQADQLVRFLNS